MQVTAEIEKPAAGVLYDDEKHSHSISSLHPLLYGFGSHRGHPIGDVGFPQVEGEKSAGQADG